MIEITAFGSDSFRTYLLKLKTLLEGVPQAMLHDDEAADEI